MLDIDDTLTLSSALVDDFDTLSSIDSLSFPHKRSSCSVHGYDVHHDDVPSFRAKQLKALQHCIELLTREERPRVVNALGIDIELRGSEGSGR